MKKYIIPTITVISTTLADGYMLTASNGVGDKVQCAPGRKSSENDDDDYGW